MKLRPVDIQHKEFRKTFRGYNQEEVDDFLDQIYDDYSELYRDNMQLKEQIEMLTVKMQHYQKIEENLQGALLIAQKSADETIATSHKQAEVVLREARMQAARIEEDAKSHVREILEERAHLERQHERFSIEFRSLLELYLSMLNNESPLRSHSREIAAKNQNTIIEGAELKPTSLL